MKKELATHPSKPCSCPSSPREDSLKPTAAPCGDPTKLARRMHTSKSNVAVRKAVDMGARSGARQGEGTLTHPGSSGVQAVAHLKNHVTKQLAETDTAPNLIASCKTSVHLFRYDHELFVHPCCYPITEMRGDARRHGYAHTTTADVNVHMNLRHSSLLCTRPTPHTT